MIRETIRSRGVGGGDNGRARSERPGLPAYLTCGRERVEGWEVGSGGLHNGVDAVRATCVYLCTPECVRTLPLALRALATQEYVSDFSGASTPLLSTSSSTVCVLTKRAYLRPSRQPGIEG